MAASTGGSSQKVGEKRKRVVLSIEDKLKIIKLIESNVSYTVISERFGIGQSTVCDINRTKDEIRRFSQKMVDMGTKNAKTRKVGEYEKLDEALYIWFRQQRDKNIPVSGPLLLEKARILFVKLYGDSDKQFTGSTGFQWRFCKRHGIRNLAIQGEKASADSEAAKDFQQEFPSLISSYTLDQIFNCDETVLYFRCLPDKTLAAAFEKRAEGRKKAKDRVTVNACANVTGSIKLPLLFIGKAKRPRCYKNTNMDSLPVIYRNQSNAWVNTEIFSSWFHDQFVPYVQRALKSKGLPPKAMLTLDNCSAHPEEDILVSRDGLVIAKFLPPNVTSLIQPMDQGVLESMKRRYRKSLLQDVLLSEDLVDPITFNKSITMKVVVEKISLAWDQITPVTIRRSWRKLIPLANTSPTSHEHSSDNEPNAADSDGEPNATEFVDMFQSMGHTLTEDEVTQWLNNDENDPGYQHLHDDEIVAQVLRGDDDTDTSGDVEEIDDDEDEPDVGCPITHAQAMKMFENCITWLQHQPEASAYSTSVLIQLKDMAAKKRLSSLKQTSITSYM